MPDRHNFNHLPRAGGLFVQCVEEECGEGGWAWKWPEERRAEHAGRHEEERRRAVAWSRSLNLVLANIAKRERENG